MKIKAKIFFGENIFGHTELNLFNFALPELNVLNCLRKIQVQSNLFGREVDECIPYTIDFLLDFLSYWVTTSLRIQPNSPRSVVLYTHCKYRLEFPL